MKPLNEEQVKVVKDFEKLKEDLSKKYNFLKIGMSIMENAFNDVLKEQEIDNKPSSYRMLSLIDHTLRNVCSLKVNENNMLIIGILKEPVNNKEKVMKECLDFISEISIHISEFEKYLDKVDYNIFARDIYDCKQHIQKVMNVIFEISKE